MIEARRVVTLILVGAAVIWLDLVTKSLAESRLSPLEPVPILGHAVRLTLVHNTGTAFGLFPGQQLPFIIFSLLAIAIIVFLCVSLRGGIAQTIAMGMLLGGAIGNVHDRLRFGEVTDFIQVGVAGHYWPVFNVADAAITAGVILLALTLLRHEGAREAMNAASSSPGSAGDKR